MDLNAIEANCRCRSNSPEHPRAPRQTDALVFDREMILLASPIARDRKITPCSPPEPRRISRFRTDMRDRARQICVDIKRTGLTVVAFVTLIMGGAILVAAAHAAYDGARRPTQNLTVDPVTRHAAESSQPGTQSRAVTSEGQIIREQTTLRRLQEQWNTISAQIPFNPTTNNTSWTLDAIQFIGKGRVLIQFEDGHYVHGAAVDCNDSRFTILRVFKSEPEFSRVQWQNIVKEFGAEESGASTYTYDSSRGEYAKTPANVFVTRSR